MGFGRADQVRTLCLDIYNNMLFDNTEDVDEGKDKTVKPLAGLLKMEKSLL